MKFFVESADPSEIRLCANQGIIDGVTFGASVGEVDRMALVEGICETFRGPVSVELVGDETDRNLTQARALARLSPQVVVRVPLTEAGLEMMRACAAEGIGTHLTGCPSPAQALQAAQAGAAYLSPLGDPEDGGVWLDLARKMVAVYKTYGIATKVVLPRVRSAGQIVDAALSGVQIASVPFRLLRQIFEQAR